MIYINALYCFVFWKLLGRDNYVLLLTACLLDIGTRTLPSLPSPRAMNTGPGPESSLFNVALVAPGISYFFSGNMSVVEDRAAPDTVEYLVTFLVYTHTPGQMGLGCIRKVARQAKSEQHPSLASTSVPAARLLTWFPKMMDCNL